MVPLRWPDQRGFTLVELTVASLIGVGVLLGVFSLYRGTTTAFNQSSSQAVLQRQGTLALQAISRQAQRAVSATYNGCAPAGTTSRSIVFRVDDTDSRSLPVAEVGDYCYYAGNGANGGAAGALCERFTPRDPVTGVLGAPGPCRDLLGGVQLKELVRQTGRAPNVAPIQLIVQTNPANPLCPQHTTTTGGALVVGPPAGQAIATNVHCLALGQVAGSSTGDVAFAISDGLNSMTFTLSLTVRN